MVNCGLIEALSVSWLMELGKNSLSKKEINSFREKTFKQRKDKLLVLICTSISGKEFQMKLKCTWTKTEDVMKFRNSIAHAPLLKVSGRNKVFYDQKHKRKINIQEINTMIDQCSEIIDEINSLWVKLAKCKN